MQKKVVKDQKKAEVKICKTEQKNCSEGRERNRFVRLAHKVDDGLNKIAKKNKWMKLLSELLRAIIYCVWAGLTLLLCEFLIAKLLVWILPAEVLEGALTQTIYSGITYVVAMLVIIFAPWYLLRNKTTRDELGLRGMPSWTDIGLAIVGFVAMLFLAFLLTSLLTAILPNVNWTQEQDVGFQYLINPTDRILAFFTLVVMAPVAEEIICRGWLYGKLRVRMSAFPAILAVSLLFGILHGQWNVAVVTFAMSAVMCLSRELTGTIWAGILMHMIKNALAFYMLFVVGM